MKILARVAGVISFLLCFTGGALIAVKTASDDKDGFIWFGMGLYFMGKAFFVGPMLWLAGEKCCSKADDK
jgi:hypothetical protein